MVLITLIIFCDRKARQVNFCAGELILKLLARCKMGITLALPSPLAPAPTQKNPSTSYGHYPVNSP